MSTKSISARAALQRRVGPLSLSALLQATREADELSQADFARKLGISKSHLSDIECGRKAVSPDRAVRFARALELSESQFVRLALQEIVDRAGLKLKVTTSAA